MALMFTLKGEARCCILWSSGADLHCDDEAVLWWAAKKGHRDIVELLLETGASIARDPDNLAWKSAVYGGHRDIVHLFTIGYRADLGGSRCKHSRS
jgi:hypothetical protein